ncbi:hypothetical protein OH492_18900 [Vibrio chagasii]|nr:hypothetical protein [Vibrio chagasii]
MAVPSEHPIYDDSATGQLDFNEWGYPVQQWPYAEDFPRLDNRRLYFGMGALIDPQRRF